MELRGVLDSGDIAEMRAKRDALQEAWTDAASALYAQASAASRHRPATGAPPPRRRGDRGRRLRGRRRRRGGKGDLSEPTERQASAKTSAVSEGEPEGSPEARAEGDELAEADAPARRVPGRAPAAEGRVRQLPQAGRARAGDARRCVPPSGSSSSSCRCSTTSSGRSRRRSSTASSSSRTASGSFTVRSPNMLAREGLVEVETDGAVRSAHAGGAALAARPRRPKGTVIQVCRRATGSAITCCARRGSWSAPVRPRARRPPRRQAWPSPSTRRWASPRTPPPTS